MAFQFSVFILLIVHVSLVHLAGQQQTHTHGLSQSDYNSRNNDGQANSATFQKSTQQFSYHSTQQDQVPVRQQSNVDYKLDNRIESDKNYIETKYKESQRRIIRIRTLTNQQNELQKQLNLNETQLNEQIKRSNLEFESIQILVNAIRNCIQKFDRIQNELEKLYRDQIYTEKQLLEHYRTIKPTDLNLHKQLKNGIERWEQIYDQLLLMQLLEKKKNQEREKKFDTLLNELESLQIKQKTNALLSKSPSFYSSSSSSLQPSSKQTTSTFSSSYSSTQPSKFSTSYSTFNPQDTTKLSSSLSSSSYISSDSYSSSLKSTDADQNPVYFSSLQSTGKKQDLNEKIRPHLEENSLIFRRPEVSSQLKDIKCLDKWFDDLGKEDAEFIARNQLSYEKFFEELVRLQKAQWDKLKFIHEEKKQLHIPQTFRCDIDKKDLCEQEEENFKKKFSEYRAEKYPTKLDQQNLNQFNFDQQIYNQQPSVSYSSNQKSHQINYNINN